jgi:hypothetical protein
MKTGTSVLREAGGRGRSVGAPPLRPGGCRTNPENRAENPVSDGLRIELQQRGDLGDGEELVHAAGGYCPTEDDADRVERAMTAAWRRGAPGSGSRRASYGARGPVLPTCWLFAHISLFDAPGMRKWGWLGDLLAARACERCRAARARTLGPPSFVSGNDPHPPHRGPLVPEMPEAVSSDGRDREVRREANR